MNAIIPRKVISTEKKTAHDECRKIEKRVSKRF